MALFAFGQGAFARRGNAAFIWSRLRWKIIKLLQVLQHSGGRAGTRLFDIARRRVGGGAEFGGDFILQLVNSTAPR